MLRVLFSALVMVFGIGGVTAQPGPMPTPAERSEFKATTRHLDVVAYCESLAKQSPKLRLTDFGTTTEGRKLPLMILSDNAVSTPDEAVKAGKPVVLAFANIHAGEVDGKEALLALARDLCNGSSAELLKKLTVLLVPNLNADGNERISDKHRTDQNGPSAVGVRENGQGFDLNRDFIKLESPEVRALVKLVNAWNPLLIVDCHTTNGSYHRYTLTYDGPRNPAADSGLIDAVQGPMLANISKQVKHATGFDTFTYGDFNTDHNRWETYPAQPRFGVQYFALRGSICLLSESYTYAPFVDRVKVSHAFVKAAFTYVADNRGSVEKLIAEAKKPRSRIAVRTKTVPQDRTSTVLGYIETKADGKTTRTDTPKDYQATLVNRVVPTLEVTVPALYVIPPGFLKAVETLQRHGVQLHELTEDLTLDAEQFVVSEVTKAPRAFQRHNLMKLEGKMEKSTTMVRAGSVIVKTAQPLGSLAAYLLEPQCEDGLVTWNVFDAALQPGKPYPVLRLLAAPFVQTVAVAALQDDKPAAKKPITLEAMLSGRISPASGGGRRGGGEGGVDWLPDGEHYLSPRGGKLMKVHARTGNAEPFIDAKTFRKSLAALKDLNDITIEQIVSGPLNRMNKARTSTLVDVGSDLGMAYFDGTPAVRLTKGSGDRKFTTLSPDGKKLVFVRKGNLFAVDVTTQTETQLTKDGGANEILNGEADWVYEEEIFNRNGKSFWFSPDSTAIAFLRYDDTPVKKFFVTQMFPARGVLESINYPKTGDPNPTVKIGVANLETNAVTFLDFADYPVDSIVVSRVGWMADGKAPFAYVQNREQTWLDFVTWPNVEDKPKKLFRDSTKAWIEDLGEPRFLADGSFLVHSDRTGWKHLYHYAPDGKLIGQVTDGEWEAQTLDRVDEADGWAYFVGTKDGHNRKHFYRAKLDGSKIERLTAEGGTHAVTMAPKGPLFVDRFSDNAVSPQSALFQIDVGEVRKLESTPLSKQRDEYAWGKAERVQVPMKDGFVLEGILTYPPDFDATKQYPLWLMTYAGPHAPTVRDGWNPNVMAQVLATSGIVVFNIDPRSASGKGSVSAWTCFKQLGVQELKDLEGAVAWVGKNSWADLKRVGISGHSYGGYMTSYAMTHSKVFSAGIAGAPVTDWTLYDSIYTERYMGLPKDNKAGYDKSSVVKAAANLHGKLLLIHGMVDDNVHMQNTAQFIDALQRANKDFEVMFYPRSRHGIGSPQHYPRLQVNFIRRTMEVEK